MEFFFNNELLFGDSLILNIPRPLGLIGTVFKQLSFICHYAGSTLFFLSLLPLLYLCINRSLAIQVSLLVLFTGITNGFAKYYFQSPRPFSLPENIRSLQIMADENAYGFPSGHSQLASAAWGFLFLKLENRWLKLISLFFIIFTPFSRIYIGVHFPGDVLGGFLMGLVLLGIGVFIYKTFPELGKFKPTIPRDKVKKLQRSFSLGILALLMSIILIPKSELTLMEKESINQSITAAGSLAGFFIAVLYIRNREDSAFDFAYPKKASEWIIRLIALVPGILIFHVIIGFISKKYFGDDTMIRFIRYGLLNFYIIYIIPLFLQKYVKRSGM